MSAPRVRLVEAACALCGEPVEYVVAEGAEPRSETQRCATCARLELEFEAALAESGVGEREQ
jgi:hypothetical protein